MNLVIVIVTALLALAGIVPGGGSSAPGSGNPVIIPVSAVTAAPVSTPTPAAPTAFDILGSGPSH